MDYYIKYGVIFFGFWVLFIFRIKLKQILEVEKDYNFASKIFHYLEILGRKKTAEKKGDQDQPHHQDSPHEQFSRAVEVLVVDDDLVHLRLLETNLIKCKYHVTTTTQASMALKIIRENKNKFDLVIFDAHIPDMDEVKQLEHLRHNKDLPIIEMMSAKLDVELLRKYQGWGFIIKPIHLNELRRIWAQIRYRKGIVDDHVVQLQPNPFIISHNPYKIEVDPRFDIYHTKLR